MQAIKGWLAKSRLTHGPLFRSVSRGDNALEKRLSADAVARIIKKRIKAIGLNPKHYSGHSLRAGFATTAARMGYDTKSIKKQTGHKTSRMVEVYIRDAERGEAHINLL